MSCTSTSTSTSSSTFTFTKEDVAKVVRRFTADLRMIAESSKSMTEAEAAKYGTTSSTSPSEATSRWSTSRC